MTEFIRMEKIGKSFGRVQALKDVDFNIDEGTVVGLVGDNGAGKSTLAKILCGVYKPDSGRIFLKGKRIQINNVKEAMKYGIETLYQDLALVDDLSIAENIFLSREPFTEIASIKFVNRKIMYHETQNILEMVGFHRLEPTFEVRNLSGGERQAIALGRCLHFRAKLVIMDEPTSHLSIRETEKVLDFIRMLKKEGIASIFISHNIDHVYPVADRFVILEIGEKVCEANKAETTPEEIRKIVRKGFHSD